MSSPEELKKLVASLKKLGAERVGSEIAKRATGPFEAALLATLAAGKSPEGKSWEPKKSGGRAYANAWSKLSVKAAGDVLRATMVGPEVYGHYGAHPGKHNVPERPMLPDAGSGIPASVVTAISAAAQEYIEEVIRG